MFLECSITLIGAATSPTFIHSIWEVVVAIIGLGIALFFAGLAFKRHRTLLMAYTELLERVELDVYVFFDVQERNKGLFHDLLKGFEDYARLCGCPVNFYIDNSSPNKVGVKFTVESDEVTVSARQMRDRLREYIEKVQKGDPLDDLPVVLPVEEHNLLLVCMKNRINFLQHSYVLQRNTIEFYNSRFKQLPNVEFSPRPSQHFYLQSGASNQASNYVAVNSPQAAQGVAHRLMGNRVDQGIHVANSFNERMEQVEVLSRLWMALNAEEKKAEGEAKEKLSEATACVGKAQTELKEHDPPEPIRIHKWLETAKYTIKAFGLTKEVADAAKAVWDAFGMNY
jgi:hypothetical protein